MGSIYGQAQIQSHYTAYCFLKQYTICICVALGLSDPWRSLNSKREKKWSRGEEHEKDAGWGEENNKGRRSSGGSRGEKLPVGVLWQINVEGPILI